MSQRSEDTYTTQAPLVLFVKGIQRGLGCVVVFTSFRHDKTDFA